MWKCPYCRKQYDTHRGLTRHLRSHNGSFEELLRRRTHPSPSTSSSVHVPCDATEKFVTEMDIEVVIDSSTPSLTEVDDLNAHPPVDELMTVPTDIIDCAAQYPTYTQQSSNTTFSPAWSQLLHGNPQIPINFVDRMLKLVHSTLAHESVQCDSIPSSVAKLRLSVSNLSDQLHFREHTVQGYKFYACDILEACYALYLESWQTLRWSPPEEEEEEDRSTRNDFVSGDFYRHHSSQFRRIGLSVLALLLQSDATIVSSFNGRTCHPITMTFGNFPQEHISKPKNRIVIAHFPTVVEKDDRVKKLTVYHACISVLLEPLMQLKGFCFT